MLKLNQGNFRKYWHIDKLGCSKIPGSDLSFNTFWMYIEMEERKDSCKKNEYSTCLLHSLAKSDGTGHSLYAFTTTNYNMMIFCVVLPPPLFVPSDSDDVHTIFKSITLTRLYIMNNFDIESTSQFYEQQTNKKLHLQSTTTFLTSHRSNITFTFKQGSMPILTIRHKN